MGKEQEVRMRGRPRPRAATRIVDRLKLHRRQLRLDGRQYTVVTLRPGTDARFSTNHFHDTWHVLSDWHGARLLGRLLWGLAYQRVPGTLVLIDRPFLDPNPFDAEPADPIALVPALLTPLTSKAARELRRRLPLDGPAGRPGGEARGGTCGGPGDGTVRWHTHGLDAAVAQRRARRDLPPGAWRPPWIPPRGFQERVDRIGGLVTFAATPAVLKDNAVSVVTLGDYAWQGMDYAEIDWPNGEVQVFRDYRRRVTAARVARREVIAEVRAEVRAEAAAEGVAEAVGHRSHRPLAPGTLNPLIWQRGAEVRRRHHALRAPVSA
jgi:hypothetical protein